jgi:hypothetical protein
MSKKRLQAQEKLKNFIEKKTLKNVKKCPSKKSCFCPSVKFILSAKQTSFIWHKKGPFLFLQESKL